MNEQNEIAKTENTTTVALGGAFASIEKFGDYWRMAEALSNSQIIPQNFRNNPSDCLIAINMAQSIGADPLMIMQNLYIVHGKPAWSSQFLISCINASGKFSALRYDYSGDPSSDNYTCIAWAYDKESGDRLESIPVSIGLAKAEGWFSKKGSKWQTMPALMMRYRAATFFARTYCPELTMGIHTKEEQYDIDRKETTKTESFAEVMIDVNSEEFQKIVNGIREGNFTADDAFEKYSFTEEAQNYLVGLANA